MRTLRNLSIAVVGALAACGGQTSGTPDSNGNNADSGASTTPGGDAGAPKGDAQAEASTTPPGDDSGSDTYPAPHHPMPVLKPLGGPVIAAMKIITVTYTGEAQRDAMRTFDDQIVKSSWWTTVTQGLGVGPGTSGGYVELDPAAVANKTLDNDTDLKPYIQGLITAGTLPAPDANTLYAMYFPQSTTITLTQAGTTDSSCQAFGAYHDSGVFNVNGTMIEAAFAVMPNCGGGFTGSASHEIIEAASDPEPQTHTGWYTYNDAWFGAGGGEIADLCESRGSAKDSSGNNVALAWNNAAALGSHNPCVPSDPSLVFFGAAVDVNDMVTSHDPTGGPDYQSEGYVIMAPGATRSLPVDVFSEAKLPHDLTLVVGSQPQTRGPIDPTKVDAITTGVTAKLSQATGRNGSKVTLSITTGANTPKGDYPFVVRAILEQTNYHSWWVILRVQ